MTPPPSSPVEHARRINRTWPVRGTLAEDTAQYLDRLEKLRPGELAEVCARAIAATRRASAERRDPKPGFYAEIFAGATAEERELFLRDHLWTRERSAQLQQQQQ